MESDDPGTAAVAGGTSSAWLPWVIGGASVAAAGASVYSSMNAPKAPEATALPQADTTEAAAYAQAQALRRRQGAASNIMTSPMGTTGTPNTTKAQLGA